MDVREYLRQYDIAAHRVRRLEAKYKELCILAGAVRSPMDTDGQPSAPQVVGNPTEEKAIKMADLLTDLQRAKEEALGIQIGIILTLDKVPGVYGDVLYERYVELKHWEQVAEAIGYSISRTFEIHREALEKLRKILEP